MSNAAVLDMSPFAELFRRSAEWIPDMDPDAVRGWLAEQLTSPDVRAWTAVRGGALVGYLVALDETTPVTPLPWVVYIYAETPGARSALTAAVRDWFASRGHRRFWALNQSGMPDEQWSSIFSREARVERGPTLFELEFGG